MQIKDIVNREIVNLTNCEQEPIHIPGSIQPHGFLVGLTENDYLIDYCSANVLEYTGLPHGQLLGVSFAKAFGSGNHRTVSEYLQHGQPAAAPLLLNLNGSDFLCTLHTSNGIHILEAEPSGNADNTADTYEQTRKFLYYMEQTSSLQQLCDAIARETRSITGYDRVMIYRFDEQYNGEVFAESKNEDLEPFLGLHYPHTDIPAQARELYLRNLLRIITDINYTPVPIYTIDNGENKLLDLSHSVLRSTSPIHVQYLQNMGVGATLTVSLIHNNKLWGLIACHHYSAKNITHRTRTAVKLQGHFITSQIDVRQSNEEYDVARRSNEALEKFQAIGFSPWWESFRDIAANPSLLEICNATGVCIIARNVIYKGGKTPADKDLRMLSDKLFTQNGTQGFSTHKLADHLADTAGLCDTAAGIVYHSLSFSENDCIMWFRGETVKEVNWGGDPNKAIVKDENGLHPRNSFRLWKEIVKCQSKPWLGPELTVAANYAHSLQKHVMYIALGEEEEKSRQLNQILKQNNEELENINWISTHDLQEPLRKIQMMASRLSASEEFLLLPGKSADLLQRINQSAHRMQTLLKDILNYTKIKYTEDVISEVNLNELLATVVADLDDTIRDKRAEVKVDALPTVLGVPFLLKQLFTNLINNSLKFSDPGKPQVIRINSETPAEVSTLPLAQDKTYVLISMQDSGIGFEQKFADSIFRIFTRLHTQNEYQGSGVGLALARKIMQWHKGLISAEGRPGEGALFNLFFPVQTRS